MLEIEKIFDECESILNKGFACFKSEAADRIKSKLEELYQQSADGGKMPQCEHCGTLMELYCPNSNCDSGIAFY